MLEKSEFLKYLIAKADEYKSEKAQISISSNIFFIVLLNAILESETGNAPEALLTENAQSEIAEIKEIFSKYDLNYADAVVQIAAAIFEPGYKSLQDDMIFGRVKFDAARRAEKAGRVQIDAVIYTEMILEMPSEAIKKQILKTTATAPITDEGDADAPADNTSEKTAKATKKRTRAASGTVDTAEQKGTERLAAIVKRTREVQKVLLENIYGQDNAVNTFVSGFFQAELTSLYGNKTRRPRATFLFAGPPGVGKTFLAESAAEFLKIPFRRFDMSEYAEDESCLEFCGSDKVYKNGHAGNVTGFVDDHPRCILLFDEVEKAHISVIYLFLQMLDAGRLRDNFTDKEVSFEDCIIIFTTNAGRNLYDDPNVPNVSSLPRRKILRALETDVDPRTNKRLFPAAICSRFASGNVVMFNHLVAHNLYTIVSGEIKKNIDGFKSSTGVNVVVDSHVPTAMILAEGARADARTVKGRAGQFFHEEVYELLRLLASKEKAIEALETIHIKVSLDDAEEDVRRLFTNTKPHEVLIFSDDECLERCRELLPHLTCHTTNNLDVAKEMLEQNDISIVICDVFCNPSERAHTVLNAEDIASEGREFLSYVLSGYSMPVYVLQKHAGQISQEEFLSFAERGVSELLTLSDKNGSGFELEVVERCDIAHQQSNMLRLAKESKVMYYSTTQALSEDGKHADINLCSFRMALSTDIEDSKDVVDQHSRPKTRFKDVIGAEDAKEELKYFVEYLKNPVKFLRRGVHSPKGVLLYGPPGTGKTLLAKAVAGESDVTFFNVEGNQFLKKYVGEGSDAVHKTFQAARKYAPSIIFIDEIDAIGAQRGSEGVSGAASNVLTAFLTEMDGFDTDATKPVFVLAATNYEVDDDTSKRSLDPALLRRFDRRIYVDLPTKEERKRYIRMKLATNKMVVVSEELMESIAARSTGMSLAELESVYELALRAAIRTNSSEIDDTAFEEAFETFQNGEKKKWSADTLLRTARHEAGHALLCRLSGEKPSYLTIVARGSHGGYMQHADREEKTIYTRAEMLMNVRTALGGRAAEIVYYGGEDGISTGASGDLRRATGLVESMICRYGMDTTVGMAYTERSSVRTQNPPEVQARINAILTEELEKTVQLIEQHRPAIEAVVNALMERDHLREQELEEIFSQYLVI